MRVLLLAAALSACSGPRAIPGLDPAGHPFGPWYPDRLGMCRDTVEGPSIPVIYSQCVATGEWRDRVP